MSALTIENFLHETRFVIRVSARDTRKRFAGLAVILAVCWLAGSRAGVAAVVASALFFEASARLIARAEPPADRDLPLRLAVMMWITNVLSTLGYMGPALILAGAGETPLVIAAFLWTFGVYVHISNTFVALPLYNWSQMVPAFGAGLGMVAVAGGTQRAGEDPLLWAVVGGLALIYGANTVQTMRTQKEIQRELSAARAQARARLDALEHLTRHDPLTGLLNRQAFDEELGRMLRRAASGEQAGVAVFLMDLDGFKAINDTYSHAAGDAVLIAAGRRIGRLVQGRGIAARLGGDEFAFALPGLPSPAAAEVLADQAVRELERPIAHAGKALRVSGSVGIALGPGLAPDGDGADVTLLCGRADQAMFRAKTAARGGSERRILVHDRLAFPPRPSLEDRRRVADALAERRIGPAYQPLVDLETGAVIGFEALARWRQPQGEALGPAAFLPLIREFGLQGDFLTAMAEQVLRDLSALLAEGLDPGRVSINVPEIALATLSGRGDLDRLLAAHPGARAHLVLEITEDVFIARSAEMIRDSIAWFRAQGVAVSLDDFGTGFASFQHLREVEFDELKIDMSFVAGLGQDPAAEVLIGGFVAMGHGLGVRLVAEGVETEEQRRHLLRLGCRCGQGFLFGRAGPLAEVRARLRARGASPALRPVAAARR